ncbi:MAG TPA: Gfo/Idh/MocA family oxidoreductase [Chthoniobacterales bacterium]|jgi:predicted dehydrogenase|nr:Gfo/Idh/MocA family oxidoreductase [Chthoniobacterales bacterium]
MSVINVVRFGVIGCGTIAYWTYLRELKRLSGARLVAAADPDSAARSRATGAANVRMLASAGELLTLPDIDAVVISAPNAIHAELAIAAAQAGKHFYLEKPIAITETDARRVIEVVSETGVVSAMGFNRRCHPAFEQARVLISEGKIGRVRAVQTIFTEPTPFDSMPDWKRKRATGGGVLLDLGSHHFDSLRWLLQDEINEVRARLTSEVSDQDSAALRVMMRSGIEVNSFFSFRAGGADTFEFIGERGILRIDRHRCAVSLRVARRFGYGTRQSFVLPDAATMSWRFARLLRPSWESSYRRALVHFVEMCRGVGSRLANLQDGMRSLEVILAAEKSAQTGRSVPVASEGNNAHPAGN